MQATMTLIMPTVAFIVPPPRLDYLYHPAPAGWSVWDDNALDRHLRPLPRSLYCSELESLWLGLLNE